MDANFIWLLVTTATLFASAQMLQSSRARVTTVAAYTVIGLFVGRRLFELAIFVIGTLATGVANPLPWDSLLSWSTLGILAAQYVVSVIVLALMYRYNETIVTWLLVLVIGSLGLASLLV